MSSNRIVRSMSLESGCTPRRLYQVVLPLPGRPMVSTTYPRGERAVTETGSAGGVATDSGWVSGTTACIEYSGTAGAGSDTSIGAGVSSSTAGAFAAGSG